MQLVGYTTQGTHALVDFPHGREHCLRHKFQENPIKFCDNCFCYVCDIPAAECTNWAVHCRATHKSEHWKRQRQLKTTTSTAPASVVAPAPSAPATASTYRPFSAKIFTPNLPVETLLNAVTRVYPSEYSPPVSKFQTLLRHYQKQSLAFMVDVEESGDSWKIENTGLETRGGWICSQVGMGKSTVVIALVASRPQPELKTLPKILGRQRVKGTVIMTSVSLMGQWEDECRKHAPNLKTVRFHSATQSNRRTFVSRNELVSADIIISSATFDWKKYLSDLQLDLCKIAFWRVCVDESHLLGNVSVQTKIAKLIPGGFRWCITATPMTSSANELFHQCIFLGISSRAQICSLKTDITYLKKHMIRHTKAQQINGSEALALPASISQIHTVHMNAKERKLYDEAVSDSRHLLIRMTTAAHLCAWYYLTNKLVYGLGGALLDPASSKILALEQALRAQLTRDPNMRAVVFTQLRQCAYHVNALVKRMGIPLYHFDGSTANNKRDAAIRDFQSTSREGPAIFVITLRSGSVGITLTAASHVFLMEPCINPASETQAAGRIHRLGQTKNVTVTKFLYADTFESNVPKLHQKIQAGEIQFTNEGVKKDAVRVLLSGIV